MSPHACGRHIMIDRQILCALARGDDLEAGGARPVHHFGGECGLVAIGQRIDDARAARLVGQQWTGQHIGFDIDHDDVLAGSNRRACVTNPDGRISGRFHDHFDVCAGRSRSIFRECRGGDPRGIPADCAASLARTLRIEIDNDGHFKAGRMRHLREKHRAELAGADQGHADGFSRRVALFEKVMQIH